MYKKIFLRLKDKYILITLAFLVWISFFDTHNLISQFKRTRVLKDVQSEKQYYLEEIKSDSIATMELTSDKEHLEKFAREKYLMKKDDEDIFLIIKEE
ncbi:MAG: septum formation inhibitor [Bacteroidales bacterium]|nr:septum formation inhibitor [Bacteroidales bacterium]